MREPLFSLQPTELSMFLTYTRFAYLHTLFSTLWSLGILTLSCHILLTHSFSSFPLSTHAHTLSMLPNQLYDTPHFPTHTHTYIHCHTKTHTHTPVSLSLALCFCFVSILINSTDLDYIAFFRKRSNDFSKFSCQQLFSPLFCKSLTWSEFVKHVLGQNGSHFRFIHW